MVEKNPITPEGAEKLRTELHHRKSVQRPAITHAIGVAREHGDLSENAEWHAAREQQSLNEARIKEIEDRLARAEIIDPSELEGYRIAVGAKVKLLNTETEEEVQYRIVGADESEPASGAISI